MTEVLVVIVVLAGLAGLLSVSYRDGKKRSDLAQCQGNLKQIVRGFKIWAYDMPPEFGGTFPWNIPAKDGGTREFVASGETFRHFQIASNEMGSPKILVCPGDKKRGSAGNWREFNNTNLSYFVGVNRPPPPSIPSGNVVICDGFVDEILAGDRHISGGRLTNQILTLDSETPASWQPTIHGGLGNIGFLSGNVGSVTTNQLQETLRRLDSVRLAMP